MPDPSADKNPRRRGRQPQDTSELRSVSEQAVLVGAGPAAGSRTGDDTLEELHQLARTAGAIVLDRVHQSRAKPHPATYVARASCRNCGSAARSGRRPS